LTSITRSVGDVRLDRQAAALAGSGDALELLRLEPHQRDVRPARREAARRLGSDTARGARDEDRLAVHGRRP
jgi:hypothetical protein